jgi:hypothetical protein
MKSNIDVREVSTALSLARESGAKRARRDDFCSG